MVDPSDTAITEYEQRIAVALMNALVRSASEEGAGVSSKDVHRVLAYMSAMVLETDTGLTAPSHFREAGAYIGEMVGLFTRSLREQHEKTGFSAMDLAAAADETKLN